MSLEKALQIAGRSGIRRYKTGAVIVAKKGNVVSVGWSHMTCVHREEYYSMHAELHAVLRADRKTLVGSTCFVANVSGKSGAIASAKPCDACAAVLKEAGVVRIVYTTAQGEMEL